MDIKEFFLNDRYAVGTGVELLEVKPGYARARLEIKPEHLNGGGVCQGGAIFTLADLAAAAAVNSHGTLTLSITAEVHFFRSENRGFIYAEAHEIYNHGKLAHCRVDVINEAGELVAAFSSMGYHKREILPIDKVE
jgi:acyl-CoA thioesterase